MLCFHINATSLQDIYFHVESCMKRDLMKHYKIYVSSSQIAYKVGLVGTSFAEEHLCVGKVFQRYHFLSGLSMTQVAGCSSMAGVGLQRTEHYSAYACMYVRNMGEKDVWNKPMHVHITRSVFDVNVI